MTARGRTAPFEAGGTVPRPLERPFFSRPSPVVARALLGCWLVRRRQGELLRVQLCETEAYLGHEDPASHARRGPTQRNLPMFGPPGRAYVYFVYGMHYCFNIVTGEEGTAAAVLVRGAMPLAEAPLRVDGPARLCKALSIGREQNGIDLCDPLAGEIWLERGRRPLGSRVVVSPRIGVRDRTPWRFALALAAAPRLPL
ncbi:MAG: DNA-3-methyladenine glycosylase [Candidatus Dormibacteria bacterium]